MFTSLTKTGLRWHSGEEEAVDVVIWSPAIDKFIGNRVLLPNSAPEIAELAEAGIAHEEGRFTLDEAWRAKEAFLTSATSFVKPITKLDGAPVGEGRAGPVTRRLFDLFARHVQGGLGNTAA